MNHIGLFEGIGGFSLAARWMGWKTVAWCEWNDFGQRVLRHHFPEAEGHGDITKTDFKKYANTIDILTGGFPCQPYSLAGKRKGKEDDRHLWPEMLRAIGEIQPSWVVGENVFGLINWDGGVVFNEVQADLEAQGYEVFPYVLPACSVNAPHRRDRVWFIAYSKSFDDRRKGRDTISGERSCPGFGTDILDQSCNNGKIFDASNSDGERCDNGFDNRQERHIQGDIRITKENKSEREGWQCRIGAISSNSSNSQSQRLDVETRIQRQRAGRSSVYSRKNEWDNFPTQSPICNGDDGISSRLDGITFPKWRNESIKAGGNAIVPQVAFQIFKAIDGMINQP